MTEPQSQNQRRLPAQSRRTEHAGRIGNAMLVMVVFLVVALGAWLQAAEPRDCALGQRDGQISCAGNAPLSQGQRAMLGSTVDLNAADSEALARLPGIGKKRAEGIIQHRERMGGFCSLAELREVRGIGPKTVARLSTRLETGVVPKRCNVP